MSRCRSCGAEIRWARTVKGKAIPLDQDPTVTGNVLLVHGPGSPTAEVLGPLEADAARADGRTLYMPLHASCPQGTAWKK